MKIAAPPMIREIWHGGRQPLPLAQDFGAAMHAGRDAKAVMDRRAPTFEPADLPAGRLPAAGAEPSAGDAQDAATQTFVEMVETGRSARTITAERALAFAESGLLGVHYAVSDVAAPEAGGGAQVVAVTEVPAIAKALVGAAPVEAAKAPVTVRGTGPHPTVSAARVDAEARVRPQIRPEVTAIESARAFDEPELPEFVTRLGQRLADRWVHIVNPRLLLHGKPEELTLVADGMGLGDENHSEIEAIVRRVAGEFGVTIQHLVIIPGTKADRREGGR
jgi:hypothetical protein